MGYGYSSPMATEKVVEKPTPARQGSLNFGNTARPAFAPPPSSSLFSGEEAPQHEEQLSSLGTGPVPATPSRGVAVDGESGNEQLDRWITVFGFPSGHSSVILSYFHNFGQILRVKHSENGGNWIHLLYTTKLQAEKALGKNGKILEPGNIMIGVVRCTDASVISDKIPGPTPSKRVKADTFNPSATYVLQFPKFPVIQLLLTPNLLSTPK